MIDCQGWLAAQVVRLKAGETYYLDQKGGGPEVLFYISIELEDNKVVYVPIKRAHAVLEVIRLPLPALEVPGPRGARR